MPIFALCGSTMYAFFESISKSEANGVTRTLRRSANGAVADLLHEPFAPRVHVQPAV